MTHLRETGLLHCGRPVLRFGEVQNGCRKIAVGGLVFGDAAADKRHYACEVEFVGRPHHGIAGDAEFQHYEASAGAKHTQHFGQGLITVLHGGVNLLHKGFYPGADRLVAHTCLLVGLDARRGLQFG